MPVDWTSICYLDIDISDRGKGFWYLSYDSGFPSAKARIYPMSGSNPALEWAGDPAKKEN